MDIKSQIINTVIALFFSTSLYSQSEVEITNELILSNYQPSSVTKLNSTIVQGVGSTISVPVIIIKGKNDGPTVGIVAAIHGNEVNGIAIIHELVGSINTEEL